MELDHKTLFSALNDVANFEFNGFKSVSEIQNAISQTSKFIYSLKQPEKEYHKYEFKSFEIFGAEFGHFSDKRLEWAVHALYLLHIAMYLIDKERSSGEQNGEDKQQNKDDDNFSEFEKSKYIPKASQDVISLQHVKIISGCVKYILFTLYLSGLDEEASIYFRMKINQEKISYSENLIDFSSQNRNIVLKATLKYLLPLFKHPLLRSHLKMLYLTEILSGILQLSFSPNCKQSEDVAFFRHELESLFDSCFRTEILKEILLLKSIQPQKKGKSWLQSACNSLFLRRFLLTDDGVEMILKVASSMADLSDWRRKEATASIIASAKAPSEQEFYEKISPQVLKLLNDEETKSETFHIVSFVMLLLAKRSKEFAQTYLFGPFLNPLIDITLREDKNFSGKGLNYTVSRLYKVYVEALPPSADLRHFLKPVICPLFAVASLPPTCHVKTDAKLVLVRYLSQLDTEEIVNTLLTMARLESNLDCPHVNPDLILVPKLNEIDVEISKKSDWEEVDETMTKCIVDIIDKLKLGSVVIEFLRKLTQYLDFTSLNDINVSETYLLTDSELSEIKFEKVRRLTWAVGLLNAISESERLTEDLFNDVAAALPIIKALLDTQKQQCEDFGLAQTRETFLLNCVMLVTCCVSDRIISARMTHSDWNNLKDLVSPLEGLKAMSENAALMALTEQLIQTVLTHGTVRTGSEVVEPETASCLITTGSKTTSDRKKNTSTEVKKRLGSYNTSVENLTTEYETDSSKTPQSPSKQLSSSKDCSKTSQSSSKQISSYKDCSKTSQSSSKQISSYKDALADVCSPLLPVRGHALISFTKLVESKDKEALENSDKILALCEHHLRDEDSYIYLAAIEGLVALCSSYPDKVVAVLTEEFSLSNQTIETRLKLIEILTKTTRRLGQVLPKYKNLFINCLLNGIKDDNYLIRASCLSNLGEVCKELRFSVESIIFEIFSLVENVIQNDPSPEVRRAAVLFITLLLQGLGKDSLKILQTVILDLYRCLKRLILIHNDTILVTQAELAMDEINSITRDFFLPKVNLQKKIFVTEVPSNSF